MVAASKMRKAQQLAINGRDYAQLMNRVIVSLRDSVDPSTHPLLIQVQAAILWAMQKGIFDSVPVDKVKDTQNKLTDFLESRKESILNDIQSRGKIDEGIEKELGAAIEEFQSFNS